MNLARLAFGGLALSVLASARPAMASELHFNGDAVRIVVDEAGIARVEHALSYRVTGSLPKGLDLAGIEAEASADGFAPVALDGEAINPARVERKGEQALRITLEGVPRRPNAHGVLVVRVTYRVDLVRARELTIDGAMWRLGWVAPVAVEGYDSARVVFDLPSAPTEPLALAEDGAPADEGRAVTLRRGPQRDELEIERPHVARSEAAAWNVRLDPRAFPRVVDPALRPVAGVPPEPVSEGGPGRWLAALAAGLAFGALLRLKWGRFARACIERGVAARGLLPAGAPSVRGWLAGGVLALGVGLEASARPGSGALAVAVAMLLAAARPPLRASSPRGPGQWLPLSPEEAFTRARGVDLLDAATWPGRATFAATALACAGLGIALRSIDPSWTWLAPLDALVLVPLFITGSRVQLPPDRVRSSRLRLSSIHRLLKRDGALRVSPWARVPVGANAPDELRLLVLPRAAMPGVIGIEVGVAWIATPAGYAAAPEVLVRVRDATAASARLVTLVSSGGSLGPGRRPVPGRKTDERVVRLSPALPSRAGAVALVRRLAEELRDRRKSLPGVKWPGAERRLPPNERLGAGVPAAA